MIHLKKKGIESSMSGLEPGTFCLVNQRLGPLGHRTLLLASSLNTYIIQPFLSSQKMIHLKKY